MTLEDLALRIRLQPEFLKSISVVPESGCNLRELKQVFSVSDQKEGFFQAVKQSAQQNGLDFRILFGWLYADMMCGAYDEYKKCGLSDTLYDETMSDLTIWAQNCYDKFGIWGIDEFTWLPRHVELRIFRLGRLQFEPIELPMMIQTAHCFLPEGSSVLSVHIPAGKRLVREECLDSYHRAGEFFHSASPVFVCFSWLLDPANRNMLPPESGILQFARDYEVFCMNYEEPVWQKTVFGCVEENPESYPQMSTLQKNAVKYLQGGGKLGVGYGVRKRLT